MARRVSKCSSAKGGVFHIPTAWGCPKKKGAGCGERTRRTRRDRHHGPVQRRGVDRKWVRVLYGLTDGARGLIRARHLPHETIGCEPRIHHRWRREEGLHTPRAGHPVAEDADADGGLGQ